MKNMRKYNRFKLNLLEVNGKMIFATEVQVKDISISGVSLKANRRLNIGSEYTLKLEGVTTISLRGTVVWSSLGESREIHEGEMLPIYSAGLQFKNMSNEKLTELQHFIDAHKINEICVTGGTRLHLRFLINEPEKAVLNFPDSYKVNKISLGGMLIECGQALEIESRIPMVLSIHDKSPLNFVGRVASCQISESKDPKKYEIGIEFSDLTEKDREVLSSFIDYCAIIEDEEEPNTFADTTVKENIPGLSPEFIDKVEYLYKWHTTMGYYRVLGINEYANDIQIKRAFLSMAQKFHPDKFSGVSDDLKHKLNEIFAFLNVARSTLMDPQKRKEYDNISIVRTRH